MTDDHWRERISIDPLIHHGDPCIKGTRVPVKTVLGSLAAGDSVEEILDDYPSISELDIQAAIRYAAEKHDRGA